MGLLTIYKIIGAVQSGHLKPGMPGFEGAAWVMMHVRDRMESLLEWIQLLSSNTEHYSQTSISEATCHLYTKKDVVLQSSLSYPFVFVVELTTCKKPLGKSH